MADPGSTGRQILDTISSPGPVPSLLQTSSITPSQTIDSNPHPPIGDFDCGGDLDISSPTAVRLISDAVYFRHRHRSPAGYLIHPKSNQNLDQDQITGVTHLTQGPSWKRNPFTTGKGSPLQGREVGHPSPPTQPPNHPTHHLSNPAVADGDDLISTGRQFVSRFISTGKTFSFQINFILKLFTYITSLFQENFPGSSTSDGNHTHI